MPGARTPSSLASSIFIKISPKCILSDFVLIHSAVTTFHFAREIKTEDDVPFLGQRSGFSKRAGVKMDLQSSFFNDVPQSWIMIMILVFHRKDNSLHGWH